VFVTGRTDDFLIKDQTRRNNAGFFYDRFDKMFPNNTPKYDCYYND